MGHIILVFLLLYMLEVFPRKSFKKDYKRAALYVLLFSRNTTK